MLFMRKTTALPSAAEALPGRADPIPTARAISSTAISSSRPIRKAWHRQCSGSAASGARSASSGNSAMASSPPRWATPAATRANPTYEEVCSGLTGHTEVVLVAYDPNKISYDRLLKTFWESHNPTQGMRQGNDVGTQYRSAIYTFDDAQRQAAEASKAAYQKALAAKGLGAITTEIAAAGEFYFAEDYHQQYLAKNPAGYCGLGGTGVACPIGAGVNA